MNSLPHPRAIFAAAVELAMQAALDANAPNRLSARRSVALYPAARPLSGAQILRALRGLEPQADPDGPDAWLVVAVVARRPQLEGGWSATITLRDPQGARWFIGAGVADSPTRAAAAAIAESAQLKAGRPLEPQARFDEANDLSDAERAALSHWHHPRRARPPSPQGAQESQPMTKPAPTPTPYATSPEGCDNPACPLCSEERAAAEAQHRSERAAAAARKREAARYVAQATKAAAEAISDLALIAIDAMQTPEAKAAAAALRECLQRQASALSEAARLCRGIAHLAEITHRDTKD